MHLIRLIEKLGDDVAARRWRIKERAIAGWRRQERKPLVKTALKLMRLEPELLKSLDDIYGPVPQKELEPEPEPTPQRRKTDKPRKAAKAR